MVVNLGPLASVVQAVNRCDGCSFTWQVNVFLCPGLHPFHVRRGFRYLVQGADGMLITSVSV